MGNRSDMDLNQLRERSEEFRRQEEAKKEQEEIFIEDHMKTSGLRVIVDKETGERYSVGNYSEGTKITIQEESSDGKKYEKTYTVSRIRNTTRWVPI